jgi:DNA mismatch endonuclease (patch repair protein)
MSGLRTAGTGPELELRRELHRRGLRFRVNARGLPGRPDVVLTRARIAVFVDGCFWHGCPEHAVAPKANAAWWRSKLDANRARDERDTSALDANGWLVIRAWEHESPQAVAAEVERLWRRRTQRPLRS